MMFSWTRRRSILWYLSMNNKPDTFCWHSRQHGCVLQLTCLLPNTATILGFVWLALCPISALLHLTRTAVFHWAPRRVSEFCTFPSDMWPVRKSVKVAGSFSISRRQQTRHRQQKTKGFFFRSYLSSLRVLFVPSFLLHIFNLQFTVRKCFSN